MVDRFLAFVRKREARHAHVGDLTTEMIQTWMDDMADADLAVGTMRVRQSAVSSLCSWLVKRNLMSANPVAQLDRPPHRKEAPQQVPGPNIMDELIRAARHASARVIWRSSRSCDTRACGVGRWRSCAFAICTASGACAACR